MLTEKLAQAKYDMDEMKRRDAVQVSEKVQDLEMQNRAMREEVRKRETQVQEMVNEAVKASNEHSKRMALVEQEREFVRREVQGLREERVRREESEAERARREREREAKVEREKEKKKALQKELSEVKAAL